MDVAVVGLGLIGGSLLRALAADGHQVYGYDADPATRATARTAAAQVPASSRWQVPGTLTDTLCPPDGRVADLVVVAVPLPVVGAVFTAIAATGYPGLVTDVTSVKGPVLELAASRLHRVGPALAGFVGGHPMAGRETSGFGAADPDLFDGCAWVLCLEEGTRLRDWLGLAELICSVGARVVPATAVDHDRAVAAISHVPHLFAATLAAQAATNPLAMTLAAGSFRDGTRVAASDPRLVAAMCGGNAEHMVRALDAVLADLAIARAALAEPDPVAALQPWLAAACAARVAWPPEPGESTTLPAQAEVLLRLGGIGGWITGVAPDQRSVSAVRPA